MKLTDHISSEYFQAANRMKPEKKPRRIIAYVESYDDVLFWRTILSHFEDETRYFEVMLPAYGHLGRGKKSALRMLMKKTGHDMIACVDADYDYLLQRHTESSCIMLNTPFVFHTHAYAIENLQCYAPGLHDVCVMTTLNDHRIFNCRQYLVSYSRAVYQLLLISVWLYRQNDFDTMSITEMDHIITPRNFSIEQADKIIERLSYKVSQQVRILFKRIKRTDLKKQLDKLAEELETMGVTQDTAYLYIHGHHLFDKVVLPMLSCVCTRLRLERERDIHRTAIHATQMNNELSCYSNSIEDITSMLKKNTAYLASRQCHDIFSDLRSKLDCPGSQKKQEGTYPE